jgi:hypothetical protein
MIKNCLHKKTTLRSVWRQSCAIYCGNLRIRYLRKTKNKVCLPMSPEALNHFRYGTRTHAQDISGSGRHSLGAGQEWRFHAIRQKTQRSQVFIATVNKCIKCKQRFQHVSMLTNQQIQPLLQARLLFHRKEKAHYCECEHV